MGRVFCLGGTSVSGSARRWALLCLLAGSLCAAPEESGPAVGPGAKRDDVIAAYGWPTGQSSMGTKEILSYPQGRVTLQAGVVERVDFSPNVAWTKPKPPPQPAPSEPKPAAATPRASATWPEEWLTDHPAALRAASQQSKLVLALFVGSDWSPLSRRIQTELSGDPEFLAAVSREFVLLMVDFPAHTPQPPDLQQRNGQLREKYGVTTYPSLLVLNSQGGEVGRADLAKARPDLGLRGQLLAAIRESRPPPAEPRRIGPSIGAGSDRSAATPPASLAPTWILGAAAVVLSVCVYLLRKNAAPPEVRAAATALPTPADVASWSHDRLRSVLGALLECDGWRVQTRAKGSGADLALARGGATDASAQVLVGCKPANDGLADAKTLRDLFATTVAEGVEAAWYVSAGGFTTEAREFAFARRVHLVNAEELIERLKSVPPLALLSVVSAGR